MYSHPEKITSLLFVACLTLLMSASVGGAVPANAQGDAVELRPDDSVEREMTTGESHSYRVTLVAGQYLRVLFEQSGINVIIAVTGPDGTKIVEVDNPSGAHGPEYVSFVAERPGDYLLRLRTITGRVNTGRYTARIEELREAIPEDRESAAAEKMFADGRQLLEPSPDKPEATLGERRKEALEKFEKARSYWAGNRMQRWEALALYSLGTTYRRMGHLEKALEYFSRALDLTPHLEPHDWRLTASVLNDSGLNYSERGEHEQAVASLTRALKLFQEKGDRRGEGSALNNMGLVLYRANMMKEVVPYLERALQLRIEEKDRAGEANILNNLGDVYRSLGEPHRALENFDKSLAIFKGMGEIEQARSRGTLAAVFNNLALVHDTFGEWQSAIDHYGDALKLFNKMGSPISEAKTRSNIGRLYYELGDSARALQELHAAFDLVGDKDPTLKAEVLIKIGEIKASQGETSEALSSFARALDLNPNDRARAAALTNVGAIKILQKDPRAALGSFEQALTLQRKIGNREGESVSLQRRGEAYLLLGEPEKASGDFEQARALSNSIGSPQSQADALYGLARAERDRGNLEQSVAYSAKALDIVESQRTKVPGQQLRTLYFSTKQDQYELYIDLRMRQYQLDRLLTHLAAALHASERSRARTLVDLLNEAKVSLREGVDAALLRQERELQQKLNAKAQAQTQLLSGRPTDAQTRTIAKEIDDLIAEYDNLQTRIKASSPKYAQLTKPRSLSLSEIQQLLDDDTLLLEYALGSEEELPLAGR